MKSLKPRLLFLELKDGLFVAKLKRMTDALKSWFAVKGREKWAGLFEILG